MCACVERLQPQDQGLLTSSEGSRLLYLPLVTICIPSLCLYYYWRGASVFLIAKKKKILGQVPDKPEKQDRNNVLRETYCSYRVSDSVEQLLGVGSRSPPSYFPLYPHVSMEYERFFWSVNKTRTEIFFCPLIIHKMNIRSLKNPLTKVLLLRQELNQLDQNTLLCACVCERMTPNNTWGLLTKQKQCVSVEPKSI